MMMIMIIRKKPSMEKNKQGEKDVEEGREAS